MHEILINTELTLASFLGMLWLQYESSSSEMGIRVKAYLLIPRNLFGKKINLCYVKSIHRILFSLKKAFSKSPLSHNTTSSIIRANYLCRWP